MSENASSWGECSHRNNYTGGRGDVKCNNNTHTKAEVNLRLVEGGGGARKPSRVFRVMEESLELGLSQPLSYYGYKIPYKSKFFSLIVSGYKGLGI